MLARRHRLRSSRLFPVALREGARARRGEVVASVAALGSEEHPRLGLIVAKKVGTSVQRHRVARVLRHAVREQISDLPRGTVVVLRALPRAHDRGSALAGDARSALRRAGEKL